MKKSLLLVSIVTLLAAACNQQPTVQQNTQTPTQSAQVTPPPQNQTQTPPANVDTQNWKTYTNTQYGFEIQLPPYWEGYTTDSRKLTDGGTSIGFNFPFIVNGKKVHRPHMLQIIVFSPSDWTALLEEPGPKPLKLIENSNYVYSYSIGQDLGGESYLLMAEKDIPKIISTFKITSAPTQSNISASEGLKTYKNSEYGFTFNYPSEFILTTVGSNGLVLPVGTMNYLDRFGSEVVLLTLPKSSFPKNSGISRADVVISINSAVDNGAYWFTAVNRNAGVPPPVIDTLSLKNTVTINGIKYGVAEKGGVAAGTQSNTEIYHTYQNGRWYEIQINLWISSDGNNQLSSSKPVWQKLQSVVSGMQYLK